jgi:hypothetical protein
MPRASSASAISVKSTGGGFTSCSQSWQIKGSEGSISAPKNCGQLTYERVEVNVDGESLLVKRNQPGVIDAKGRSWSLVDLTDGKVALAADFDTVATTASIILQGQKFQASVSLNYDDGLICNSKDPFSVTAIDETHVKVTLNPMDGQYVDGTVLSFDKSPDLSIAPDQHSFIVDLQNHIAGQYTYTNLKASKGRSTCLLQKLLIDFQNSALPVAPDELHIIGIYGARNQAVKVSVKTSGPAVLVLASYESQTWEIDPATAANVKKVIVSNYYGAAYVNNIPATKIEKKSLGYAYSTVSAASFVKGVEKATGLVARSKQFSYESNQFLVNNAEEIKVPSDAKVYVLGGYIGNSVVNITKTDAPVVLVLNSYAARTYTINTAPGVNLIKVIYNSYEDSYGSNVRTSILGVSLDKVQRLSYGEMPYYYSLPSTDALTVKQKVQQITGIADPTMMILDATVNIK